ncbi:receptor-like protein 9a [Quercus suber]|uniref:Receptor-like protein 9a n=1 Tax=Quercus suber TaxID=58331 RepID=A0AAW0LT99_QUESU
MKEGVSQNFLMGWPLVKSLLWALLLFVQIHEHIACIEEERAGLLELKAFLKSHTNYTKPLLPTWVYETKGECCSWERVNCSTATGHPFKDLRILDLSDNGISGWLGNEGM